MKTQNIQKLITLKSKIEGIIRVNKLEYDFDNITIYDWTSWDYYDKAIKLCRKDKHFDILCRTKELANLVSLDLSEENLTYVALLEDMQELDDMIDDELKIK